MTKRRRQRVRAERARRIRTQAETFLLLGCMVYARSDLRTELNHYRDLVRDKAPERVRIALSCAIDGLSPSTAMKLLNATLEEERTV